MNPDSAITSRDWIGIGARGIVAAVWIAAAFFKLADPAVFARDITNYRIISEFGAALAAVYLPWLELALGVALFTSRFREAARWLSIVLLVGFCAALIAALARGLDIRCGCFGATGGGTPAGWALGRNLVLLALLLCAGRCARVGRASAPTQAQ